MSRNKKNAANKKKNNNRIQLTSHSNKKETLPKHYINNNITILFQHFLQKT